MSYIVLWDPSEFITHFSFLVFLFRGRAILAQWAHLGLAARARHLTKEKNDNITRHTNIWRSYTYHCLADKSHTYYKLQHLAHSRKAA